MNYRLNLGRIPSTLLLYNDTKNILGPDGGDIPACPPLAMRLTINRITVLPSSMSGQ